MNIEIITPSKVLYSGQGKLVQLPGNQGQFEILNNHAPIISTLAKGRIKLVDIEDNTLYFEINGGVVECQCNRVIILTSNGNISL